VAPAVMDRLGGLGAGGLRESPTHTLLVSVWVAASDVRDYQRMMEVEPGGALLDAWDSPDETEPAYLLPNRTFAKAGDQITQIGPEPPADGKLHPTSIHAPVVNIGVGKNPGEWKNIGIEGFSDTVWTSRIGLPHSGGTKDYQTDYRSLKFFLPTTDGGALVGGRLWRIDAQDTTYLSAVKLAPGYAVSLRPGRGAARSSRAAVRGGIRFDAIGRPLPGIRTRSPLRGFSRG
jgi:hypothetical protein